MTASDGRLPVADPARHPAAQRAPRPRPPVPPPAGPTDLPRYLRALTALADRDDLAAAHTGCDLAVAAAREWRDPASFAAAHSLRCSVSRRRGDLAAAGRDGRAAADLLTATGADRHGDAAALLLGRRIAVLLDVGDVAAADALMTGFGADVPDAAGALPLRYLRGVLHAAAGRPGEGLADLFACGERLAALGTDSPAVLPWRSAAARVLAAAGTTEAAQRLVDAEVALARRGGPPSALGRALRLRGAVLSGPAALAALDEAVRVLAGTPRRFEYARALVDHGIALNTARRRPQARRVLREGLDLAEECGSPALADSARAAHAAAGGKARPAPPTQAG